MTLSLTCGCGVLLEVDETFAGQTITCPDCQRPLQVPAPGQAPQRTSGLALASLILALLGAFTVLGTLVAAVLGGVALLTLRRERGLAGRGFALAGLVLGVGLTALSLFAYSSVELFGLDVLLHEPQWAGKLDYDGPLEVVRASDGFRITRPSKEWGVLKAHRGEPDFLAQHAPQGLLLVNPHKQGYVACVPITVSDAATLDDCKNKAKDEFARLDLASTDGPGRHVAFPARVERVADDKTLPDHRDIESAEMVLKKRARRQERTFIVRVVRKRQDTVMYLVAAGCPAARFEPMQEELRQALNSFELIERDRPADWQMPR